MRGGGGGGEAGAGAVKAERGGRSPDDGLSNGTSCLLCH